jgi:hypothetical protein
VTLVVRRHLDVHRGAVRGHDGLRDQGTLRSPAGVSCKFHYLKEEES